MIDWLTIVIALVIIAGLVGGFGFLAWKMNMSDPMIGNENQHVNETTNEKKRKEKHSSEQSKKKRKDQKKSKRESKDEESEKSSKRNPPTQTSEETDDEREESEQELLIVPTQTVETSSKARKRNKNKTRTPTPPPSSTSSETQRKNSVTTRVPPATHPKSTSKDESESTKQPTKSQTSTKPTASKKATEVSESQPQEQPFTVVGGNRNKPAPVKPQPTTVVQSPPTTSAPRPKETPVPTPQANPVPVKSTPTASPKIADLIKVLPSSQAVVTEIMSALDAFALSAAELDIIMHKIANKQSVVKQDWSKLQQGQKVDPQAHIGQALDESAKAYGDSLKNNSSKHLQELTHELQMEKRRNHELLKEKQDKDREIQILHAQLDSIQQKSDLSNPIQLELKRLTEENLHLTRQLAQQSSSTSDEASDKRILVLSEQMKKLSVDNANWEKKAKTNESLLKEIQQEKEELLRSKEQLTQSLENLQKESKKTDEKLHEYQARIDQLEKDNEQLKREEIIHIEPSTTTDIQTLTVNNEEREQFENEIQQLKQRIELYESKERDLNETKEKLTKQIQLQENDFKQEIERVKQQTEQSRNNELNEWKTKSHERVHEEREKHRQLLTDLLSEDLRHQLPSDHQDFDQWLSSYRQIVESNKKNLQQESEALRRENAQIHQNMTDVEKQLKDIEKTVQSKEESLLTELKKKDTTVDNLRGEKDQLTHEVQHLRQELQTVRANHDAALNEVRTLKVQLNERILASTTSPSIVAADESFELLKQPSPSLSPIVVDARLEPFNDIIRSSKEGSTDSDDAEVSTTSKLAADSTRS